MTDPENRFHALKFAIGTCGVPADPNFVVATAHFYLAFLEGLTQIRPEQPAETVEPEPVVSAMTSTDDWMGKPDETVELADHTESYADEPVTDILAHKDADVAIAPLAEADRALVEDLTAALDRHEDASPADAWQKHHEAVWNTQQAGQDFHTRYGLQKGQITEPVLETSVAEKPQAVTADEQ